MNDPGATLLFRKPQLSEAAVRSTLRGALAARRRGLPAVDPRSFGNQTLAALHALLGRRAHGFDELAVYELEAATVAGASRFLHSALGRRLLSVPVERLRTDVREADAAVLDERKRLHVVRLECCASDSTRLEITARILAAPSERGGGLVPAVHLFSLRDGRRRTLNSGAREFGHPASNARRYPGAAWPA